MNEKKLGMLWAIICIASVILMFLAQSLLHWEMAWILPMIGVLICFIATFALRKNGED